MTFMEKEFLALKKFLDSHSLDYSESTHEVVHTSEQAAAIRGVALRSGVKAIVFKISSGTFVMALVRGDHRVDAKKLASLLNVKNAKLASPGEVLEITGCEIGSVHPFGNLFGLDVYMDKSILENGEANFSAGLHTKSIVMSRQDMVRLINPAIADIAKV